MYHEFKICLLGDTGVGKSSIVQRFVHNTYTPANESTIGACYMTKTLVMSTGTIKLNIWDTAGQERYRALAPMYYRSSSACIIVYDVTSRSSFESIQSWVKELRTHNSNQFHILAITGNKSDLNEKRQVSLKEGKTYAESIDAFFIETSAKTSQNVNDLFHSIVAKLPINQSNSSGFPIEEINESDNRSKSSSCCGGKTTNNSYIDSNVSRTRS